MNLNNILKQPEQKLYVRLSTSHWYDRRGIHVKRSLTTLRRKSNGAYDLLVEDAMSFLPNETFEKILNLNDCSDGVYIVKPVNITYDCESGLIDDYNYKLIEVNDETQ